jgi:hypothetical protein
VKVIHVMRIEGLFIVWIGYPGLYYRTLAFQTLAELCQVLQAEGCGLEHLEIVRRGAGPFVFRVEGTFETGTL